MSKIIPIISSFSPSSKAQKAPMPDLPRAFFDAANYLLNDRFNEPGDLLGYMTTAYKLIDKVNSEFVSKYASCSRGCSSCCRMDVQITSFEAQYISNATGIPGVPQGQLTRGHKTACPFMSQVGECTIYAVRPLFCRTYHVLSDPQQCAVLGAPVAQYGSIESGMGNAVFHGMATWVHFQNHQAEGEIKDIRDFFPHKGSDMRRHVDSHRLQVPPEPL